MWNKDIFIDDLVKNMPNNTLIKISLNFLLFFINWYKYITKIWINKIKGRIILAERWPTYEYYILYKKDKKILVFLYLLYNYFFPKPDITFILKVDPKIIIERKNELEFEEILELYEIYSALTKHSKKILIIENNDKISKTLNKILKTIIGLKSKNR
jgi:thymidylate kinase